jgi:hypothetical protein
MQLNSESAQTAGARIGDGVVTSSSSATRDVIDGRAVLLSDGTIEGLDARCDAAGNLPAENVLALPSTRTKPRSS